VCGVEKKLTALFATECFDSEVKSNDDLFTILKGLHNLVRTKQHNGDTGKMKKLVARITDLRRELMGNNDKGSNVNFKSG